MHVTATKVAPLQQAASLPLVDIISDSLQDRQWYSRGLWLGSVGPPRGGTRRVASDQPAGLMGYELPDFRLAYALVRAESTPLASEPILFPSTR
jgi:hypothetical protein